MSEFKCERCGEHYDTTDDHEYQYICMDCQSKREEALEDLEDKLSAQVLSVDDVLMQLDASADEILDHYKLLTSWLCNVCDERVPISELATIELDGEELRA